MKNKTNWESHIVIFPTRFTSLTNNFHLHIVIHQNREHIKKPHKTFTKDNQRSRVMIETLTWQLNISTSFTFVCVACRFLLMCIYAYTLWKITSELVIIIKITIQLPCTKRTTTTKEKKWMYRIWNHGDSFHIITRALMSNSISKRKYLNYCFLK